MVEAKAGWGQSAVVGRHSAKEESSVSPKLNSVQPSKPVAPAEVHVPPASELAPSQRMARAAPAAVSPENVSQSRSAEPEPKGQMAASPIAHAEAAAARQDSPPSASAESSPESWDDFFNALPKEEPHAAGTQPPVDEPHPPVDSQDADESQHPDDSQHAQASKQLAEPHWADEPHPADQSAQDEQLPSWQTDSWQQEQSTTGESAPAPAATAVDMDQTQLVPAEWQHELEPQTEVEIPPVEVIDTPARPRRPARNSQAEVADLFQTLQPTPLRPVVITPEAAISQALRHPVERRRRPPASRSIWAPVAGWASIFLGVASLAMACLIWTGWMAVPVGAAGFLFALVGVTLALGSRQTVTVPVVGAICSAGGIVLALLGANGFIPVLGQDRSGVLRPTPPVVVQPAARTPSSPDSDATQPAPAATSNDYVPATSPIVIKGVDVELKIESVIIWQPVARTPDYHFYKLPTSYLQITFQLRAVGPNAVNYTPWRMPTEGERPKVTDAADDFLKLVDLSPNIVNGSLTEPVVLSFRTRPISDVLLFEQPGVAGDLKLELPGENIGAPGTVVRIKIPVAFIRTE
jgi:hypothetical protein